MKEEKQEVSKTELMTSLKEQIDGQIATLTTKLPSYSELSEESKEKVDSFIDKIDISNPQTIDEFGKDETERIYKELDMLIGTMRTHDLSIDDMFTELMMSINEGSEMDREKFIDLLKKSPVKALKSLRDKPKKIAESEKYRRAKVLTNIDVIQEKLEGIRNELRTNAGKLDIMAENSKEQYINTQYQIIALQEVLRRIREEQAQGTELTEKTFEQIDRGLILSGAEKRITRKMDNYNGISVNAATKAIMARLLAQHNEELASDYDQDLTSLLPELKGVVVTAEANDSLMKAVDTHNQFVDRMNEMLREESNRSKEAIEKVQDISKGSAIDVETARVLTSNVIEVVTSLKRTQDAGRPTNDAFNEIMSEFRGKLAKELKENKDIIPKDVIDGYSDGEGIEY